ncbi:MAG: polysaccharide pyruvyl transferase family protein, partial [Bacteriovoracaceae bacterium]
DNINEVGSEKVVVFNFYETFTNPEIWPNAEMKHTALIKFIHEAISKLIELGYKVTLLPFGTSGDAKFARKVHQKYKEQTNVTLFIGESYQEIMDVFKGSHFSLTMRFHAGLILFLSGVPSICIDQQFKSERFLQDVGLSEFLIRASDGIHSAEEFELDSKLLDNKISYLEENYERVRSEMASYHDKKKAEFENYIQIIKEKI